ncbi:MAG: hypothetical protein KBD76_00745 [Bacteriovorax sp.]|nr:hypothetical protein [Bacteriovorax sp.]
MKFLRLLITPLILGLLAGQGHAASLDEVTLEAVSTSSHSLVLDRGSLENYTEGLVGRFFVQVGEIHHPKIFLVGEGRLVKSFPKKSYWYLQKIYLPKLIAHDARLLVLTTTDVSQGRPFQQKQRHVLLPSEEYSSVEDYLGENTNNVPDRLIQDLDSYELSDELFESKLANKTYNADQLIQTYEVLKKKSGQHFSDQYQDDTEELFYVGPQVVNLADLKKEEDRKLLESLSLGMVKKVNAQRYALSNGLYKNQKKAPGQRDINDQITMSSVYETKKEEKRARTVIAPKAIAKYKRDGQGWSEDMDDEALRRYFIETGLEQEKRRRDFALNELEGNEILFHYTGSLSDHSTSSDNNYRNLGYSLSLSYDLHLSRTSKDLKNWSLQFSVERGVSDYDLGGQNARGQEGSFGGMVNYYFINNPLTLNSVILLGGLGIKAGSVDMGNQTLSKGYSYQQLTLPSAQLMMKYRFRSGDLTEDTVNVGTSFNFGLSFDRKRLSVIDNLSDNIGGKFYVSDLKYIVGLGFYF